MAKISVIVPVYKVEETIGKCIESILNQTYPDFELILIDDGSPDRSGVICDEYSKKDGRIKVIHKKNAGVSSARNAGIEWVLENSDSEWISFVDSDDWVHSDYLSKLYGAVEEAHVQVAICNLKWTKSLNDKFIEKEHNNEVLKPETLYLKNRFSVIAPTGKLYQKKLFEEIRYPIGKIREDEFVTWKILFSLDEVVLVSQALYAYYQRNESIMHQRWSKAHLDAREAFEEELLFFEKNGYSEAYLSTVSVYINFMLLAIENLNRYYPRDNSLVEVRERLKDLYREHRKTIVFPQKRRLYINIMILPINANIIPWIHNCKKKIKRSLQKNVLK